MYYYWKTGKETYSYLAVDEPKGRVHLGHSRQHDLDDYFEFLERTFGDRIVEDIDSNPELLRLILIAKCKGDESE